MSSAPKSFRSLLSLPPSHPSPADTVLIIVDAQNEYDHGLLAISNVASSRAVIGNVLQKWRQEGGDVVHVLQDAPGGEGAVVFTRGTELAEEFGELRGGEGGGEGGEKIIHKVHPSSFTGTDLAAHLDKLGKKKIALAGYMAHVCISNTSRTAAELGYSVSIIRDAVGDRDIPGATARELIDISLAELGDVSATIVGSGEI